MKFLSPIQILFFEGVKITLIFVLGFSSLLAQKLKIVETQKPEPEGFNWGYILILGLGFALGGAIFWWLNWRKGEEPEDSKNLKSKPKNKAQTPVKKSLKKTATKSKPLNREDFEKFELAEAEKNKADALLPIFAITEIKPTKPITPLPLSNDESLLGAIEQANEELEEDEEIRGLALKVLAAFKNRNSVEAISQIALYDLSAKLRSKAVSILAEFDHQSVFETILLTCADPSREVRAAAARGLFRLSFERTEAWLQLAEAYEISRVRQAARAVIAGDFVQRSLERLIHPDKKYAFEAFAIVLLLIRAGETEEIFEALNETEDKNLKRAILHSIKIANQPEALALLNSTLEKTELMSRIHPAIEKNLETNSLINQ